MQLIAAAPEVMRKEAAGRYPDGRQSYVELHRHAMRLDGRWTIVSISRDITERKLAELAAQRFARMFAALSDTNEAIMRAATPQDLYQRVCDAAVRDGKLLGASVCVLDENWRLRTSSRAGVSAGDLLMRGCRLTSPTPQGRGLIGFGISLATALHQQ